MNIVVLGAGAVGGYFGGKLALAGIPVTFLVREHRYVQLQHHRLHVQSVHGDFALTPNLALTTNEIEHPNVVMIALKNYHLDGALPQIRDLVQKGAKVLPLLNGVQHIDRLVSELGQESVLGGACYIEATLDARGHILQTSPMHDIIFGSLTGGNNKLVEQLENALQRSGIPARHSQNIMMEMWKKFIFLTSFSGITAATRKSIGDVLRDEVSHEFLKDIVQEIVSVAKTRQVDLPVDAFDAVMNKFSSVSPQMTSSLHRDLEKGLPLEIDSLQGSVLDIAKSNGIPTPSIHAIYALLHPYRDGNIE